MWLDNYKITYEQADAMFHFELTQPTRWVVGEIIWETQEIENYSRIYEIEIDCKESVPNVDRYVELIGKFIEYIQSSSDEEIRISISLNKTIPEVFYDQLIGKLSKSHVDKAVKNLKESKIILICE